MTGGRISSGILLSGLVHETSESDISTADCKNNK